MGEVGDDEDTNTILDFEPDRMGHCCKMGEEARERMYKSGIPIEVCPTSNVKTRCAPSYEDHPHRKHLFDKEKPTMIICTDDSGVFNIDLTHEYMKLCHDASRDQVKELIRRGLSTIFLKDGKEKDDFVKAFKEELS